MNHKQRSNLFPHPALEALRRPVAQISEGQALNTVRAAMPGRDVAAWLEALEAARTGLIWKRVTDETAA